MNTISLLTLADLDQTVRIERRCQARGWSAKSFIDSQKPGYLNYRMDVNGTMAGFAICQLVADEASLLNLAIDPDYQRRGLARQLLQHLIGQLRGKNIAALWLEVRQSNTAARHLYQQLGFNEVTIRHDYYPPPSPARPQREHAIIMALPLAETQF